MRGLVLTFSEETSNGIITAEDGHRYTFTGKDWCPERYPGAGIHVDFEVEGAAAVNIYLDPSKVRHAVENRMTAVLLAFFFGWLGFHKFYLGNSKPAVIMLCTSIGGMILLGIPTLAMMVIGFVEFLIYITMTDEAFEQTYIISRKNWF